MIGLRDIINIIKLNNILQEQKTLFNQNRMTKMTEMEAEHSG
jgi:hypothetical protein